MIDKTLVDNMYKNTYLAVPKEPDKPDLRLPPSKYGAHSNPVCTICSAKLADNDLSQEACKYYQKSKYKEGSYGKGVCIYSRNSSMCDKLTINDKELN